MTAPRDSVCGLRTVRRPGTVLVSRAMRAARWRSEGARDARVTAAGRLTPATPASGHRVSARELRDAFREQIAGLCEGGVDLLLFETFGSLAELVEAVGVGQSVGDVPIVAQMTFV